MLRRVPSSVPERYRKLRELDGAEYSVLAWCAMLRGVRGVRVHHWLNDPKDPFADNPGLADAVKGFNADFGRLRPRLGRLLPAGESEDRAARVAVLEGWSGDDGVLMLVVNLRYDTGIDPQTKRRTRPFAVSPIRDYALSYRLPKWLTPDAATDALSGERLEGAASNGVFKVTVPELGSHRLIWIGNAKKGSGNEGKDDSAGRGASHVGGDGGRGETDAHTPRYSFHSHRQHQGIASRLLRLRTRHDAEHRPLREGGVRPFRDGHPRRLPGRSPP